MTIIMIVLLSANTIFAQATNSFEHNVYVAGAGQYIPQGSTYYSLYPKYWVNGTEVSLLDASINSGSANSIFVIGSDVYVAGSCNQKISSSQYQNVACYWKNGQKIILSTVNSSTLVGANCIYVVGNDVYVVGYEGNNAILWKNGVATNLSNGINTVGYIAGTGTYNALSVAVLPNGTIHIAGLMNGQYNGYTKYYAVHWTIYGNTVNTKILSTNSGNKEDRESPNNICFYNNDIYISGNKTAPAVDAAAKYWKNDTAFTIPFVNNVVSMYIDNTDMYFLGQSGSFFKYWKNGIGTNLTESNGVNDMFIIGTDVYVGGSGNGASGSYSKYWKNGTEISLANGISASSIFVTSNNAFLKNLSVNQGILFPNFNPNDTSYLVNVGNSVTEINITATTSERYATVIGAGTHTLNVGNNPIEVTVTASNGTTTKTYTINVVRAPQSNNANLQSLTINPGTLLPQFSASITSYLVNVPYDITGIAVSATAEHQQATVLGNGYHSLNIGNNIINVTVTAENETTIKTYTINVVRADIGHNANLKSLTSDNGTLTPAFASSITNYTLNVPNNTTGVVIIGEAFDENANVTGNGYYSLTSNNLTVNIVVTAEDGVVTKTYTINVVRADIGHNANLKSLTSDNGTLTPAFASSITNYTLNVPNNTTGVVIIGEAFDENANVTGNGYYSLTSNNLTVNIVVTAEDGVVTKTYSVIIIREEINSINDIFSNSIYIYPNPVNDELRIKNEECRINSVKITDLAGKIILNTDYSLNTINVSSLLQGVYLVKIDTNKGVVTKRVIKN